MSSSVDIHCLICLDHLKSKFVFRKCLQKHCYCHQCVKKYVSLKIQDGSVNIKCPHPLCYAKATNFEIQTLITTTEYSKLCRLREMKKNPSYRECSACSRQLIFSYQVSNIMTCQCGKVTCFSHGDAHPNETCDAYSARVMDVESANHELIATISKKCPNCGVNTERNGGCEHMVCSRCMVHWNWVHGPSYYQMQVFKALVLACLIVAVLVLVVPIIKGI